MKAWEFKWLLTLTRILLILSIYPPPVTFVCEHLSVHVRLAIPLTAAYRLTRSLMPVMAAGMEGSNKSTLYCLFWARNWTVPQMWWRVLSLLQFDTRCSWVTLISAFLLVSSCEGLSGRCCPALFSSHVQSIPIAFASVMMVPMLSWLQQARRCWLEMISGQNIRRIHLTFLVWKVDSLLGSVSIILNWSEPYSRVESRQLWYSLSLILMQH